MKLNSKKKNTFGRIFISILFILMFYLFLNFFSNTIKKKIVDIHNNINLYFLDNKKILKENSILKKEIQNQKIKNIFSNYYYEKSKKLEKRLSFSDNIEDNRKIFNIFSSYNFLFQNGLILENQKNSNKKIGDLVYTFDNFVIGKIKAMDDNFIKVERFYDINVKTEYIVIEKGEVVYKGIGLGDSSGLIKLKLPREIALSKDSVILLNDNKSIAGIFLRDDFKSQNTERVVYFKTIINPENILTVEI